MIIFEKIRWRNFLSTGNVFTEVNLLSAKTNLIVGTNGAGKSTILDALTFSLFGKPFRKINKGMLVNSVNEKDCVVEIEFKKGPNKFKVIRGIKPNNFEIYQNGEMLDQSSNVNDYQKLLEQTILKMNYKSFTQIVVLGSSTFVPFMRLPGQQRREIIEDILDIQIFSVMNTLLKDKVRSAADEMKDFDYKVDLVEQKVSMQKEFISTMCQHRADNISEKKEKIKFLTQEISDLDSLVGDATEERDSFENAPSKLKKLNTLKGKIQQKFATHKKQHEFFSEHTDCPTCGQSITEELKDSKVAAIMESINELKDGFIEMDLAIKLEEERDAAYHNLNKKITKYNTDIHNTQNQIQDFLNEIEALKLSLIHI